MQNWFAAFAVCVLAPAVAAQDHDQWRFWTAADGLQETFSYSLGLGPDGSATVRHGAVRFMSVLDGYRVVHIVDPHGDVRVDGVTRGRAAKPGLKVGICGADGQRRGRMGPLGR